MASTDQPTEVASKVLRRAHVSKMTRTLQNRLALANVKIKHGWQDLSLDHLEPRVDVELKRKRPGSSNLSDASSVSERFYPTNALDSSPLQAPIFSDDLRPSNSRSGSSHSQTKRPRYSQTFNRYPGSSNHARTKVRTSASTSWKNSFQLPESSPVYHRRHARFGRTTHAPSLSFVSETSTIPDDPRSPLLSEDDDEDLPISSFQLSHTSHLPSTPPRVPRTPPLGGRSLRLRQSGFNAAGAAREGRKGDQDAGLLMSFATSPSPARHASSKPRILEPSTPPPKSTPLPSSMMSTPGGGGSFPPFGLQTPSTNVNFADFLNMSPSPAQVTTNSWNRTPVASKTPVATRESRRRLNFDSLLPPTGDSTRIGKVEGLGMDLGGELVS
ncbi:hypothetical protein DM02DRAFT_261167 [Periconia macrospinosa]|uniref:Transcription factor Nrm1/Whi5 n=1 Tax=Periconia macrospinosa TaxID=97972 RepID=A0A2V1DY59_9PLEO|nr:hypothetical protein DM02DRAFT_261167 [Periconia macrospinosa]